MANPTNTIEIDKSLAATLAEVVSDGTRADVIETAKVDEVGREAAATDQFRVAAQLTLNAYDDAYKRVVELWYQHRKVWRAADLAALEAYGSIDNLIAGDLGLDTATGTLRLCVSVDGAAASTWAGLGALDVTGNASVGGQILTAGAEAGDAGSADADDVVIGDGTVARGITISTGTTVAGGLYFSDTPAAWQGAAYYSHNANSLFLAAGGNARALVRSDGLHPNTNDDYDLGLTSVRWRTGFFATSVNVPTVQMAEAASTPGGDPGAGSGKFWVEDEAPTVPKFTDDTNVAHTLAYAVGPSAHSVRGTIGRGSTNTRIIRWDAVVDDTGAPSITFVQSAANGDYWEVSEAGIYSVSYSLVDGGTKAFFAIKAAAALSNTFDETSIKQTSSGGAVVVTGCWTGPLAASNRIWVSTSNLSDPDGSDPNWIRCTVTRIR